MNHTATQRTIILGTSIATALVVTILVFTGGRKPVLTPVSAPAGEAALPMLDGVNHEATSGQKQETLNETPAKAESKPVSEPPPNH